MKHRGVLPTTQFAYRKGLGTCDARGDFGACRMHCKVHWRVGRRLGSYRLISVEPLTGSTISEFCISSVSVGIGGSVLSILTEFLSNRPHPARYGGRLTSVNNG